MSSDRADTKPVGIAVRRASDFKLIPICGVQESSAVQLPIVSTISCNLNTKAETQKRIQADGTTERICVECSGFEG